MTSFDWNDVDPNCTGTSSVDNTCTVWDLQKSAVGDSADCPRQGGLRRCVGRDARVRVGVHRCLGADFLPSQQGPFHHHLREPQSGHLFLRLACNKRDLRYIGTILMDSSKVVVLDIRSSAVPVAKLDKHRASVNAIAWPPRSSRHICCAGDDGQALIRELPTVAGSNVIDPMSMYYYGV